MKTTNSISGSTRRFGAAVNWVVAGLFAALIAIALAVAAFAAAALGLIVGLAALLLRLAPARSRSGLLEGVRTPDGWVVEAGLRR